VPKAKEIRNKAAFGSFVKAANSGDSELLSGTKQLSLIARTA
jgi:hypothetical protein